ncbi:hypothetical protein [Aeromonas media]|uniref:hypothetical protein n=1 Tax=Aeromonas media TaxID=651 RepID=UPI000AE6B128|nr:hypothetical protein [Aeromonas media]
MEKFIKNALSIYITKFGNQIVGLLLIPLISSKLTSDEIGVYLLYLSVSAFSVVLFDYASSIIGVRGVSKSFYSIRLYVKYNFAHKITISILFLLFGGGVYLVTRSFEYFLLVVTCIPVGMKDVWYYQARLNMSNVVWFDVLSRLLQLFIVYLIPANSFDIKILFVALFLFESISCFFYSYPLFKIVKYSYKMRFVDALFLNIKSGSHVFSSRLSGAIYTNLTLPISLFFFGADKIIVFGVCERILRIIVSLISPIIMTSYPYLSKDKKNKEKVYSLLRVLGVGLSIFIFLFIDKIAMIIFGVYIDILMWQRIVYSVVPYFIVMGSVNGLLELNLSSHYKQNNLMLLFSVFFYFSSIFIVGMFGDESFLFICLLVPELCFYIISTSYIRRERRD